MPITNLGKAEQIISELDGRYFENKKGLLNGEGTELRLNYEDIYNFIFKKPGNILDQLSEIGRLYAESFFTRTTGHKMNDFKTVFREFQSYMATQRMDFYDRIADGLSGNSQSDGDESTKKSDKEKRFEDLLKNDDRDGLIKAFVDELGVDEKQKRKVSKEIKKHVDKIDKNLNKIKNILGNKKFSDMIDLAWKNKNDKDLLNDVKDVLQTSGFKFTPSPNCVSTIQDLREKIHAGLIFTSITTGVILAIGAVFAVALFGPVVVPTTTGLFGAYAAAQAWVETIIERIVLSLALVAGISGLTAINTGIISESSLSTLLANKLYVRQMKRLCNNLNNYVTEIFEEMHAVKNYIARLNSDNKSTTQKNSVNEENSTAKILRKPIRNFIKQIDKIWEKYATAEKRVYMDFGRLSEIVKKSHNDMSSLTQKRSNVQKEIDNYMKKQSSIINEAATRKQANKLINSLQNTNEDLAKYFRNFLEAWDKKGNNEEKKMESYYETLSSKQQELKLIDEEINQLEIKMKTMYEKGLVEEALIKRSNKNTSPLGLAKQGLALTLCNIKYKGNPETEK